MDELKTSQPLTEATKWREDFPVDQAQEHFVERREFTKFLLLISGSFVFGQVYIGLRKFFRSSTGQLPLTRIASANQLTVNEFLSFEYPGKGDSCLLLRLSETKYVAYSSKCTHLMCPVVPKMDQKKLYCPCHNGWFSAENGDALAGPPPRALPQVKLKFMNGDIYAEGMLT